MLLGRVGHREQWCQRPPKTILGQDALCRNCPPGGVRAERELRNSLGFSGPQFSVEVETMNLILNLVARDIFGHLGGSVVYCRKTKKIKIQGNQGFVL